MIRASHNTIDYQIFIFIFGVKIRKEINILNVVLRKDFSMVFRLWIGDIAFKVHIHIDIIIADCTIHFKA